MRIWWGTQFSLSQRGSNKVRSEHGRIQGFKTGQRRRTRNREGEGSSEGENSREENVSRTMGWLWKRRPEKHMEVPGDPDGPTSVE